MKKAFLLSALLLFVLAATAQISETEKNDLRFMRQEEKMAHDFYASMLEKWGGAPFKNIVKAEKRHLQLVKAELDRNKIADPLAGIEEKRGEFADAHFKKMYDDLLAKGLVSLPEALRAGALIEETDINDLQTRLNETADAQIRSVYTRLIQGSENHLRAFTRSLKRQGLDYAPQVLSQADFDRITASDKGQGRGQNQPGRGRARNN